MKTMIFNALMVAAAVMMVSGGSVMAEEKLYRHVVLFKFAEGVCRVP